MPDTYDHLPTWATQTCDDCGEVFLPGYGSVWSSRQPDIHTHGGLHRCRAQAEAAHHLPVEAILMHQALVEASQTLGRWISEADDEDFTDAAAPVVFSVLASLERGLDAYKLVKFPESVEAPSA